MLVQRNRGGKQEWCLVSVKTPSKVLKWFGTKRPSKAMVQKEEARVEMFKHMKKDR